MESSILDLAPALAIDARLADIERDVDVLLNTTPVNAAEACSDFQRSDFGTVPTLRLRPLGFEADLVLQALYDLEVENVTDPALHTLFRSQAGHSLGGSRHLTVSLRVAAALRGRLPDPRVDVIGDKVVEINAESPGGMQSIERLYGLDVCPTVIRALERRTLRNPDPGAT